MNAHRKSGNGQPVWTSEIALPQAKQGSSDKSGDSGRRLVILGLLGLFLVWIILGSFFLLWRVRYRQQVQWGETAILSALAPVAGKAPPGVDINLWNQALGDTQVMLRRLIRSGILSKQQMQDLRAGIQSQVRGVRPEEAVLFLLHVWDTAEADGGNVLGGIRYPVLIAPAMVIRPLEFSNPPGIEATAWHQSIEDARDVLVSPITSGGRTSGELEKLAETLASQIRNTSPARARQIIEGLRAKKAERLNEQSSADPARLKPARSSLTTGDLRNSPRIVLERSQQNHGFPNHCRVEKPILG
jgi:hypothetical protein